MVPQQTLLQYLQSRTIVDCDTMDVEVPRNLGPFVDCTSNQAIAFGEAQKPKHAALIHECINISKTLVRRHSSDVTHAQLAVECVMVKLQLEISYHITGFVHVQINPYDSYDTERIIKDARRIVQIFKHLDPNFDTSRVCIKIPSTWEGLNACKKLESSGIATLATTLFTIEQAAFAGEVGCHYIAPYVNELRAHFDDGFTDKNTAQTVCFEAQRYYEKNGIKTQVMPASLTSTTEIMELAGVHHMTVTAALLEQLANIPASSLSITSLFDQTTASFTPYSGRSLVDYEAGFRIAFTRNGKGEGERKLSQAINIFCDMQDNFEAMMSKT